MYAPKNITAENNKHKKYDFIPYSLIGITAKVATRVNIIYENGFRYLIIFAIRSLQKYICINKTANSHITVAKAAPVAPKIGIKNRFNIKSVTAPTITE